MESPRALSLPHGARPPMLGIAPSSSSGRNPAFVLSSSRFPCNNTAWVSSVSCARWSISPANSTLSTDCIKAKASTTDRTFRRCKCLIKCHEIGCLRSPSILGSGSHRGSSILLQSPRGSGRAPPILSPRRGAHSPPAIQIPESHAGSARKRTEYSHQLNRQPIGPSHLISYS